MSEFASIEEPEPEPSPVNILEGVPCGHNMQPLQTKKFFERVSSYANHPVVCTPSDYFEVSDEADSSEWRHNVNHQRTRISGLMGAYGVFEVLYFCEGTEYWKTVPGVFINSTEDESKVFVAAEDTRCITT